MLHAFKTVLLGCGALAALALPALPALAADLDQPIFIEQAPEIVPVEIGNGWYLRADIGYALETRSGAFNYRTFNGTTYSPQTFATSALETDVSVGGGVGYQFTNWLRGDVTLDVFNGSFDGTTVAGSPCAGQPLGTTCRTVDGASFDAYSLMANAYVDLGTYAHFTPYVGAGAGFTWLDWGTLTNTAYCAGVGCVTTGPVGTVEHAGLKDARFTYSLMAGASYELTNSVKLDMGYRYSKVEGGDMFAFDSATAGIGATGTQGTDDGFEKHDIRVGVRYSLW